MDTDAAYAARLMAETDEGLATEVMGWSLSPTGHHWYGPPDEKGRTTLVAAAECWHPSSDWADLGMALDKATTPGEDGQRIAGRFVAWPTPEGWSAEVPVARSVYANGYGPTKKAALAMAILSAARLRRKEREMQVGPIGGDA